MRCLWHVRAARWPSRSETESCQDSNININLISRCGAIGSALALGARCCRFESCHFDQNKKKRAHPSSCCFHKIIRRWTSANACICLFCAPISFDLVSFRRKTMVLSPVTSTKIAYLPPKNRSNKCKINIFSPVAVYRNVRLGVELARFRFLALPSIFILK